MNFDPNKLIADLADSRAEVIALSAAKTTAEAQIAALTADRDAAQAQVATLTAELETAKTVPSNQADYDAALAFLGDVLTKVTVAAGGDAPTDLPKTVTELKAAIEDKTKGLTAILPIDGVANVDRKNPTLKAGLVPSAFSTRNLSN